MRLLVLARTPEMVRSLRKALESAGFVVDTAAGFEASDYKVRTGGHDVILLDLPELTEADLDVVGGWRHSGVPGYLLTVLGNACTTRDGVRALETGADDYLIRPFCWEELLARLRALIRRRYEVKNPIIRVHDLEIDTAERSVRRGSTSIRLTAREYSILQFLALHRGKVVTRSMIWDHLYNEEDETTSNVVDVYIGYLRAKIDKGFDPPLILTRWGQGYMLRGDDDLS
ncbi:MAG: response regulator transcription factor [Gemmataceae bacterium]|nr:response regulator transcription factor [Gemmataceae bacterium]